MMNPKESPEQAPQDDRQPPMETGADELETLSRQLAEAETSLAGMRETLLRERADLENQRKRMQRDLEQSLKFANEKLLRDLLGVRRTRERAGGRNRRRGVDARRPQPDPQIASQVRREQWPATD